MVRKNEQSVQGLLHGDRYIAVERSGVTPVSRGGEHSGEATWRHDPRMLSTAALPDDVGEVLAQQVTFEMDRDGGA